MTESARPAAVGIFPGSSRLHLRGHFPGRRVGSYGPFVARQRCLGAGLVGRDAVVRGVVAGLPPIHSSRPVGGGTAVAVGRHRYARADRITRRGGVDGRRLRRGFGGTFMGITTLALAAGARLTIPRATAALTAEFGLGQMVGPLVVQPSLSAGYRPALLIGGVARRRRDRTPAAIDRVARGRHRARQDAVTTVSR